MFERGYLTLFRVRGVPVRAHWSVPLGLLLFSGGQLAPGLWLGVFLVILWHELGHAFLVHRVGLVNRGIDLTGFGGRCAWVGSPTPLERSLVAWGGIWAQLLLFAVAAPVTLLSSGRAPIFAGDLLDALTRVNLVLVGLNLIPLRPLDGAEAWPLFAHLRERHERRRRWRDRLTKGSDPRESGRGQTLSEALDEADRRAGRR